MASVKFLYGTKANYDALQVKDNDTLYFLTDTLQFFKGTSEYTKSVKNVSALPLSGQIQGVIYFRMTDYTMHKLMEWQKAHGLAADGICGMATWGSF